YLDVLGRTPYVAAGLCREKDGFLLTFRMPRGRKGMGSDRALHLPPAGQSGSLPLLEPRGVLYSESSYLDQGRIWRDRAKLFPVKLKLVEEKHAGCVIVGYRFLEDAPLKQDVNDIRFNFSPCFARAGNQFVFCSTLELCRELVDILQKESKSPGAGSPARDHSR